MKKLSLKGLNCLLFILVISPLQAFASSVVEEVVVVAQRQEAALQDAPIAVTAFTANNIESAHITNIQDISLLTPGLQIGNSSGVSTPEVYIRGIGSNDFSIASDTSVGFYVDDVYIGREAGFFAELLDVERIEVLRGPQGVLFGRNTIGGAIHVITKKPSEEGIVRLVAEAGNYDAKSFGVYASGMIVPDLLSAKIALKGKDREGYASNRYYDEDKGDQENASLHAGFSFEFDTASLDLNVMYSWDTPTGIVYKPEHIGLPILEGALGDITVLDLGHVEPAHIRSVNHDVQGFEDRDMASWSAVYSQDFDSLSFKSITAYKTLELDLLEDSDGTSLEALTHIRQTEQSQTSQEFHLSQELENGIHWFFGAFLYQEKTEQYIKGEYSGIMNLLLVDIFGEQVYEEADFDANETESYAVFSQVKIPLNDRVSISLGLRYTYEEKRYESSRILFLDSDVNDALGAFSPTMPLKQVDDSWNNLTPSISVEYAIDSNTLFYVTLSEGFKSGGFNDTESQQAYDPETLYALDAGLKLNALQGALRSNTAAFYYKADDLQVQIFTNDPLNPLDITLLTTNAAEATIYGLEEELSYRISDSWTLSAAIAWLHAEYDTFLFVEENTDLGIEEVDYSGNRMKRSPEWSTQFAVQYFFPQQDWGQFDVMLAHQYTSRFYFTESEEKLLGQSAYHNVNVAFSWASNDEHWRCHWYINNVFDKDSANAMNDFRDIIGTVNVAYNAPRAYWLTVAYRY